MLGLLGGWPSWRQHLSSLSSLPNPDGYSEKELLLPKYPELLQTPQ